MQQCKHIYLEGHRTRTALLYATLSTYMDEVNAFLSHLTTVLIMTFCYSPTFSFFLSHLRQRKTLYCTSTSGAMTWSYIGQGVNVEII